MSSIKRSIYDWISIYIEYGIYAYELNLYNDDVIDAIKIRALMAYTFMRFNFNFYLLYYILNINYNYTLII